MSIALLGVDIGTTNLKAVAFAIDGRQLAVASCATTTTYPHADWAELDSEILWHSLVGVIREVVDGLPNNVTLAAIAFTGMAEAGLPLDKSGAPLYPAISWFDRRVLPQMQKWKVAIGADRTAAITGLPIAPAAGVLRPLWLRDEEPKIFEQLSSWLNLPDYAAYKLCGAKVTEHSLASRMMMLDLQTKQWSEELLGSIALDVNLFGELAPSATQIGTVHREAAALTGLPIGLPVCTAGHDHLCAAVGLNATSEGDLFDSIGTAEAVVAKLPARLNDPKIAAAGIAQGVHVLPNSYYAISGNSFGGGSIDWVRQLLQGALPNGGGEYEALIDMASNVQEGSGGVFFLPHLRQANPPILDALSRGAFVGLSSETGAGHIARAVLEGLAFEYQRILDEVSKHFGATDRRLVAAGGGTRNRLLMQIKADVSGLPIEIPDVLEATCLGAALAAGVGAGVYQNYGDALAQVKLTKTIVQPDATTHAFYRERYEKVYVKLYDSLKSVNHEISKWVNIDSETST